MIKFNEEIASLAPSKSMVFMAKAKARINVEYVD